MKKLKDSIPVIEEKEKIDAELQAMAEKRKVITKDMPGLIELAKKLQEEIDATRDQKKDLHENLENLDKQLDKTSDKRKTIQGEIDSLKEQRQALEDKYYGQMIDYTKYQYLVNDIKWMKEMQAKLQEKKDAKDRYAQERKERDEKRKREIEERKQQELERKQREEERRLKEQQRKAEREANLRQTEVDQCQKHVEALNDHSVGTNPMFESIELCEFLLRYCQKQLNVPQTTEKTAVNEEKGQKQSSELEKALAQGKI